MSTNNITVEEARLIDARAKEKHSEETEYDYTKQVQNEIQALVEASLIMESGPTRSLTPSKPGFYNGVRITTADIAAYKAAHPQNDQIGVKRQEYADILSAGGTLLKEEQEQEQPRENIKPHKRFPTRTASTHSINANTFSYTAPIEEESYRMGPVELDDTVTIVDDKVGKDGLFSYVLSFTNDFLYIPRKYLTVLDDVVFAPYNDELALADGGEPPLWLTFPINEPQYVPQRAEIQVAVFLERETLPESDIDAALEEAFYLGVQKILKYSGKRNTTTYIEQNFVEVPYNDRPAQAVELYLDTRTESKVKALVKIPRRNIDPLEDENPDWKMKEEYRIEKFSEMINQLADSIDKFKKRVDSYKGTVNIFDAKKESEKLRKMPETIKMMADINEEYNKDILKDTGTLTIYWGFKHKILKITFKKDTGRVYLLASNFSAFPDNSCIKSKRTQAFISNLKMITKGYPESGALKTPWKEFIQVWTEYPKVQFIPDPEEVLPPEEKEGPKVKTREELLKEDNYYNNVERKVKIAEERTKKSNDVSPSVLNNSSLQSVAGRLQEGSDTLYDEFLNSVDFRRMSLQALGCALQELPIDAFMKIKNDHDVLKEEYETTKMQYKEGKLLDFLYPDDLPTDDISEAFFGTLGRTLGTMTSSVISSVLGSVLSSLFGLCADDQSKINAPFPSPLNLKGSLDALEDLANQLFGEGNVPLEAINGILSDLANLLSPKEFCDLLRGNPSRETLNIVKGLLEASYCSLGLDTDEEIINFFLSLANGMELDICDEIEDILGYFPEDFLCPPDSSIRDRLLAGKEMTQEQIDEQMRRERDRSRRLAEQLLNDLNDAGFTPNLFCSKDEEGNVTAGETSFMDDQFIYTLENTINSLFKETYDSFTEDGERYIQNLFVEEEMFTEEAIKGENGVLLYPLEYQKVVKTIRKPIPQLTKFYKNPEIIITDREVTIEVPRISSGILNELPEEVNTNSLFSESAAYTGAVLDNENNNEIINKKLEKITLLEEDSLIYSDIREQTEVDNTEKIPEENKFNSGVSDEDECATEESTPILRLPSSEELGIDDDIIESLQNAPLPMGSEKDRDSLTFKIKVDNKSLSSNKKISTDMLKTFNKHMSYDEDTDTTSLLESLIIDGLNEYDNKPSSEERSLINEKMSVIKEETSRKVLIFLTTLLKRSKYLRLSSTNFNNDELGISSQNYIIDYINLGPVATPEYDPHLLMISEVLEKIKENLQEDMCLDLNPSDKNGRPRLTPLEKNMMDACIRITFRHYILECFTSGILSTTSLYGRQNNIDGPIVSYILEKMKSNMLEYSSNRDSTDDCNRPATFTGKLPNYYEEFLEQVEEVYGSKSMNTLFNIVKSEFITIRKGFYDALLMPDDFLSVVDKMLKKIPEVEEKASGDYSFINFEGDSRQIPDLLPFVFHNNRFCLLLDEFPLKKFAVKFNDGSKKFIVPLVEAKESFIKENIFNFCFPIEEYKSMISIHEMETVSKMDSVQIAFGDTRDNLFSLFYAILPEKDDWRKQNTSLASMGGTSNYTRVFDFNNDRLRDTPCTDFSFNVGNPDICWGNPFKGLGFAKALRAARDAALVEFKKYVERNDPTIKLAKRLSFLSKLACVNIPTSAIAGALNVSAPPWFPVTPIAKTYHSLGLGVFASSSMLSSNSAQGANARKEIQESGLKLAQSAQSEALAGIDASRILDQQVAATEALLANAISQRGILISQFGEIKEQLNKQINSNNMISVYASHLGPLDIAALRQAWVENEVIPSQDKFHPAHRERIMAMVEIFTRVKEELASLTSLIEQA